MMKLDYLLFRINNNIYYTVVYKYIIYVLINKKNCIIIIFFIRKKIKKIQYGENQKNLNLYYDSNFRTS